MYLILVHPYLFLWHGVNFKQNQSQSYLDKFFNPHKSVSVLASSIGINLIIIHPYLFSGITSISNRIHLNPIRKDISIDIKPRLHLISSGMYLILIHPYLFPVHGVNFKQNQSKSNLDEFFNLHKSVSVLKFKRNKFNHHPSLPFPWNHVNF